MKIKLKDLIKERYEKQENKTCWKIPCCDCPFKNIACTCKETTYWIYNKDVFSNKKLKLKIN